MKEEKSSTSTHFNETSEIISCREKCTAALGDRGEVVKEDGVVEVAAAVEPDGLLERDDGRNVALVKRLLGLLHIEVEVGHVRGVVLGVVELEEYLEF